MTAPASSRRPLRPYRLFAALPTNGREVRRSYASEGSADDCARAFVASGYVVARWDVLELPYAPAPKR